MGRSALRWARRFAAASPLTSLGLLLAAGSAAAYFGYARPREDHVVALAALAGMAFVAAALLEVLVGWWILGGRRLALPEAARLEAGRGFLTVTGWPRLAAWPFVDVRAEVETPAGLSVAEHEAGDAHLSARHRTRGERLRWRWVVEDGFGLARVRRSVEAPIAVRAAPWLGALGSAPAITAWAAGEVLSHPAGRPLGDRVEMRPYARGDPLRRVLWKVYARTGELMVRTAERSLEDESRVHAFLCTGRGDEASAAAAWVVDARGLLGPSWRFGAPGLADGTADVEGALDAIAGSRGRASADALGRFLEGAQAEPGARLLLFVPCRDGPWRAAATAAARRFRGRVTVVLAHDGEPEARGSRWRRPAGDPLPAATRPTRTALADLERALEASGALVVAIDRRTGAGPRPGAPRAWEGAA